MNRPILQAQRLLVVEDEYLVARHLCRMIRELGGTPVGPAPNIAAAREHLAAQTIDAAVLDIKLRDAHVFPLADDLAAAGIPMVFITGYDHGTVPERFAGRPVLEKPVRTSTLARAAARALPDLADSSV